MDTGQQGAGGENQVHHHRASHQRQDPSPGEGHERSRLQHSAHHPALNPGQGSYR